MGCKKRYKW